LIENFLSPKKLTAFTYELLRFVPQANLKLTVEKVAANAPVFMQAGHSAPCQPGLLLI